MELTKFLTFLAAVLPVVYGAPTQTANELQPEILAAMKRDLGLNSEQAHARVARELQATEVIENLRRSAGDSFAGAWFQDDELHVGVTDESLANEVRAAGANVAIRSNSLSKLEKAKAALDKIDIDQVTTLGTESTEATGVAAYYVDVTTNKLVLEVLSGSVSHAESLASEVGLGEGDFEVRTVEEIPTTLATIVGGNAYLINRGGRCSIGFSVTTGFVTAGHCGAVGASASTQAGETIGSFAGRVFPGSADMAFVRTTAGQTLSGRVNNYNGGTVAISGSTVTAIGGAICRSGSTTGVYCGTVRAYGATVNYSQGRVTGLTQTNVCAEPGDSGGSWYSGSQAQGVTSGGSGNCNSGGTTYYQPVNEILQTYGLTLVRG